MWQACCVTVYMGGWVGDINNQQYLVGIPKHILRIKDSDLAML